jgi:3-deoxy-manno-octulosonate cytidylyltransferase (CMP-KDO synthetase)
MNYAVIIPARYQSSRYPGKPLIDLDGKSMICRVWERCAEGVGKERVYIATDDDRIAEHCSAFTHNIVKTSDRCLTGTDRVAEAARALKLDCAINVQGDEPLIEPGDVLLIRDTFDSGSWDVVNAMCPLLSEEEYRSGTIPKVVATPAGKLLYMSRSGIPGNKSGTFGGGWKQVCIYAFSRRALEDFSAQSCKTPLEEQEDIEILRFLELGYEVQMVKVSKGSIAIDTPEDREKALRILHAQTP